MHQDKNKTICLIASIFTLILLFPAGPVIAAPPQGEGLFAVSLKEAEDAVARALEKEGAADIVSASITSTRAATIYRHRKAIQIAVKTLKFDEKAGEFSANLYFTTDEGVMSALPVSGRFEEMVPIPVVRHRMTHGEAIMAEDMDEILYPAARLRKDIALSPKQVIGKSPVRIVSKERPIRLSELKSPPVLQKGDKVQMRFHTPFMAISTLGEAMEEGAQGDSIKVRNYESGAVVVAHIASASEVYVGKRPFLVE